MSGEVMAEVARAAPAKEVAATAEGGGANTYMWDVGFGLCKGWTGSRRQTMRVTTRQSRTFPLHVQYRTYMY